MLYEFLHIISTIFSTAFLYSFVLNSDFYTSRNIMSLMSFFFVTLHPIYDILTMRQRYINSISAFMLTLFVSYWLGITMFGHTHNIDGATIVHSHPWANAHKHSENTILTLNAITSFVSDDVSPILYSIKCLYTNVVTIIYTYDICTIIEPHHGLKLFRAPPVR